NALTWIVKRRAAAVPRFRSQRRAQPARVLAAIEQLHHAAQGVRWIDAVQKDNPGHIFRLAEAPERNSAGPLLAVLTWLKPDLDSADLMVDLRPHVGPDRAGTHAVRANPLRCIGQRQTPGHADHSPPLGRVASAARSYRIGSMGIPEPSDRHRGECIRDVPVVARTLIVCCRPDSLVRNGRQRPRWSCSNRDASAWRTTWYKRRADAGRP